VNGAETSTRGAAVSVDPVTATLPVSPVSVHSGVPPTAAAVGQESAAAAGPAPARGRARAAALAARTTKELNRVGFTPVTLQVTGRGVAAHDKAWIARSAAREPRRLAGCRLT
jgi:hypothetical protein